MLALKGEALSWVQWHAAVDGNSHGSCAGQLSAFRIRCDLQGEQSMKKKLLATRSGLKCRQARLRACAEAKFPNDPGEAVNPHSANKVQVFTSR